MADSKIIWVGLDVGTEGTGVAIGTSEKNIYEHSWASSDNRVGSDRSKTRTAVVVDASDYSPVAFGDHAYDLYADRMLADPEKTRATLLLFDYYKMTLATDEKSGGVGRGVGPRKPVVFAVTGEAAPAVKIFAAAFNLIHKSVFDRLTNSSAGRILAQDITWVITVPTMWSDASKQIMREAAKAGFPDTKDAQIKIALEPEAAALCCRAQQLQRQLSLSSPTASLSDLLKVGARFIVADLGAGTADFSELAVATDGTLKETAAASGGGWGGHKIEKKLLEIFDTVFGKELMTKFKQTLPVEYHELERNIRNLKHRVDPTVQNPHRLSLPFAFIETLGLRTKLQIHKNKTGQQELPITADFFNSIIAPPISAAASTLVPTPPISAAAAALVPLPISAATPMNASIPCTPVIMADVKQKDEKVDIKQPESAVHVNATKTMFYTSGGFLKLSHELVMSLFDESKNGIINHLTGMLQTNPHATMLFLVGGFAESRVIQHAVDTLLLEKTKSVTEDFAPSVVMDKKSNVPLINVPTRVLPLNPGLCVMNGAVHFGMNPSLVSERISKMSFGIVSSQTWNETMANGIRQKEFRTLNGKQEAFCPCIFSSFNQVGDVIQVDAKKTSTFIPAFDRQEKMTLQIIATPKKGVLYSDDPSVVKIGQVTLNIPMPPSGRPPTNEDFGLDREIVVNMKFGTTEISVTATEAKSGNSLECFIDCLDFDLDASSAKLTRRS